MSQNNSETVIPDILIKKEVTDDEDQETPVRIKVEPPEECDVMGAPCQVKSESDLESSHPIVKVKSEPVGVETVLQPTTSSWKPIIPKEEIEDDSEDEADNSQGRDVRNRIWVVPFNNMSESLPSAINIKIEKDAPITIPSTKPGQSSSSSKKVVKKKTENSKTDKEASSHGDSEIHRCLLCPLEFRQEINLKQHVAWVHFGDRFHSCPHCGRRFFELIKLSRHMASMHKADKAVVCPKCNVGFNGNYLLQCHMILEHPSEKARHTLNKKKNDQKSHLIIEDKFIDRSRVENINKRFLNDEISGNVIHETSSSSSEEEEEEVDIQPRKILKVSHPIKVEVKVERGEVEDTNEDDEEVILEREVHVCPECDRQFVHRKDLDHHLLIHTAMKPFECIHCWKWFIQEDALKKHLEEIHPGVKVK